MQFYVMQCGDDVRLLLCCALPPQVVWDCREGRERSGSSHAGGSLRNSAEANLAASLVHGALPALAAWHTAGFVGVCSPAAVSLCTVECRLCSFA
jgi:hypothetical protein